MIGLLNTYQCDKNPEAQQLEYGLLFLHFLNEHIPDQKIKSYAVGLGELPKNTGECDGWIITGSPKSVYDNDSWILDLGKFVQEIDKEKRKLIGVCFGHQLIAHFLGGKTEKSKKVWGLGVREFIVDKHKSWMRPELNECSLIFSHQDQVVALPKGAELLGHDEFCPHQIYSIGNHIFSFQGHPEFTAEFAKARLNKQAASIPIETYEKAVASLNGKTNAPEVGRWMNLFFKV